MRESGALVPAPADPPPGRHRPLAAGSVATVVSASTAPPSAPTAARHEQPAQDGVAAVGRGVTPANDEMPAAPAGVTSPREGRGSASIRTRPPNTEPVTTVAAGAEPTASLFAVRRHGAEDATRVPKGAFLVPAVAARRTAAPASETTAPGRQPAASPPTIHVTIGRVEVRAVAPVASPRRPSTAAPALSLDEYLRQRSDPGR